MLFQKSFVKLNYSQTITLANLDPQVMLQGNPPSHRRMAKTPELGDYIKADLDEDYRFGQYLLTGSSTPVNKASSHHSGAGRIAPIFMGTLSLSLIYSVGGSCSNLSFLVPRLEL